MRLRHSQTGPIGKVFGSICITELVRLGITKAVTEVFIIQPVGYDISTGCMRISKVTLEVLQVVNGDIDIIVPNHELIVERFVVIYLVPIAVTVS